LGENLGLPWDFLADERQLQRLHREHTQALAIPAARLP
jgi:hypothetical protein